MLPEIDGKEGIQAATATATATDPGQNL